MESGEKTSPIMNYDEVEKFSKTGINGFGYTSNSTREESSILYLGN